GTDVGPALLIPVIEVIILQPAFPRLVANRAVDRVVEQNPLLHEVLIGADFGTIGDDDGAIFGRRLTGRDEFGHHRHFASVFILRPRLDQAHATTRDDR